jgi:hypothetical protein
MEWPIAGFSLIITQDDRRSLPSEKAGMPTSLMEMTCIMVVDARLFWYNKSRHRKLTPENLAQKR